MSEVELEDKAGGRGMQGDDGSEPGR